MGATSFEKVAGASAATAADGTASNAAKMMFFMWLVYRTAAIGAS
jgi:hypothetical protein